MAILNLKTPHDTGVHKFQSESYSPAQYAGIELKHAHHTRYKPMVTIFGSLLRSGDFNGQTAVNTVRWTK